MWDYFLLGGGLLLVVLGILVLIMGYPSCNNPCNNVPSFYNGPLCFSVNETEADPSIPTPSAQPYLGGFSYAAGVGPPFCAPTWYAYRYVRNSDGRYGPLSRWTGYSSTKPSSPLPIYAGASTLPCPPSSSSDGSCNSWGVPTGEGTSTFNQPRIVTIDPLNLDINFDSPNGYTLNVHRQVGTFDPSSEGEVVGYLIPASGKITSQFIDAMFNPHTTTRSSC